VYTAAASRLERELIIPVCFFDHSLSTSKAPAPRYTMARLRFALLLALAAACAVSALPRNDAEQLHQRQHGRLLKETAISTASGGQSASASAAAGPGFAQTAQSATGGNAQVQGISQVGQKVDVCQRGPADSAECKTLTTADRTSNCTDIAPDVNFTCAEQAKFGKCDADFIFLNGYCLSTCNRCGSNCLDVAPSGRGTAACSQSDCDTEAVKAGPYCLKTCGRCSTI
jgi:hypothetical protein